jgi:DNA-binding NarL/FixJ family response regulator
MKQAKEPDKINKTRIVVVDDHQIIREGILRLLEHEPDLVVCGEADSRQTALQVISQLKPDMAIIDLSLKDSSGIELIKQIRPLYPQILILVLSIYDESLYAERMIKAGAQGYIMKQELTETLLLAIRKVVAGEIYMSDRMSKMLLGRFMGTRKKNPAGSIELLSDRELEVFELIGKGLDSHQIAENLNLSVKTVQNYREYIKKKLKLKDYTELIQQAFNWVHKV